MELLKNRVEKMNQNQKYNHLVIFAEGGTTAADKIIKFKRGIFSLNYPIKVEGLKHEGRIENSMSMMKTLESFTGLLLNIHNQTTHYELDSLIEPAYDMPWEEYAEEVRTLMCNEFGFKKGNGTHRDKWELYKQLTGRDYKD